MKYLLLGGTGTLGTALVERLYNHGHELTVFSRGELAQKQMAHRFPDVKYVIGDIRDKDAVNHVMYGKESVFLLAAIKHVEIAEANPLEAIKTNVLGVVNVASSAIEHGVKFVIFSNTDKSVLPITTYGYTKALAQNYLLSLNGQSKTRFSVFNWGNVVASRGSVIPTFVKAVASGHVVPLTDPNMTRFWLTIGCAADFMLEKYMKAPTDRALIPPIKAASIVRIVESIARLTGAKSYVLGNVGIRGVEKIHEVLSSSHEGCLRSDTCAQYSNDELDDLLRQTVCGEGAA